MPDRKDPSALAASATRAPTTIDVLQLNDALLAPIMDLKLATALAGEYLVDTVERVGSGRGTHWRLTDDQQDRPSFLTRQASDLAFDLLRRLEGILAERVLPSAKEAER